MPNLRSILTFMLVVLVATMVLASPALALAQSVTVSCKTDCADGCELPSDCCEKTAASTDTNHEDCCAECHLHHLMQVVMHPAAAAQGLLLDLPSGYVTHFLAWHSADAGADLFRPPCL